ncbi:hypothetical protein RHMOL_Rhmol01G0269700 [Rhododendron molle]|uniref:Uncharacterized protein n=1 Tax=Rhododendron molle TaxID=49168 RepID=A0ACC0Q946_RHOML|nr:hypothetical protein RHMOL_Rhmol01G0269700 [Rhododendron molle]
MVNSWLADALMYELWVASDGSSATQARYTILTCHGQLGSFCTSSKLALRSKYLE